MEVANFDIANSILKSLRSTTRCALDGVPSQSSEEPQGWFIAGVAHHSAVKWLWPGCGMGGWIKKSFPKFFRPGINRDSVLLQSPAVHEYIIVDEAAGCYPLAFFFCWIPPRVSSLNVGGSVSIPRCEVKNETAG